MNDKEVCEEQDCKRPHYAFSVDGEHTSLRHGTPDSLVEAALAELANALQCPSCGARASECDTAGCGYSPEWISGILGRVADGSLIVPQGRMN